MAKKIFRLFIHGMKCSFYTYNIPCKTYYNPAFQAKPIKIDRSSKEMKFIEATLASVTAAYFAQLAKDIGAAEDQNQGNIEINYEPASFGLITMNDLEEAYIKSGDPKIVEKHIQLYKDAYEQKNLLRGGYVDLADNEIDTAMIHSDTVTALGLLGKGNLEYAFGMDIGAFNTFTGDIASLATLISKKNLELLKSKINPENTVAYRNTEEEISKLKKRINKLLGSENLKKRKQIYEEIEKLKQEPDKKSEIKNLKNEAQRLYMECENAGEIKKIMQEICEKQKAQKEILSKKVDLLPKDIISKVWTIAALLNSTQYTKRNLSAQIDPKDENQKELLDYLNQKYDFSEGNQFAIDAEDFSKIFATTDNPDIWSNRRINKDAKELIGLIRSSGEKNDKLWQKAINKQIYGKAGFVIYDEKLAEMADLANCKYANELVTSEHDFWTNLNYLLQILSASRKKGYSVEEILDYTCVWNINSKVLFDAAGLSYEKWACYNPESYIDEVVVFNPEDARGKTVKNMCDELTSTALMKHIPKRERISFYKALEDIGVKVDVDNKIVKIDKRDVEFEDLPKIMSAIKNEMNTNQFWSQEYEKERTEKARDTLYNHFMHQRKGEIDCAKNLKNREVHNIRVQKVNMSDIKHAISLGNDANCCTALGSQSNEWSAPAYIYNRCISAIEILSDGEPVGNTMIYVAYVGERPALILDDIELQTKYQNNEKIKNTIIKYAQKICAEIGKPNMAIYAGPGMHKIDMSEFRMQKNKPFFVLGQTYTGVYLDYDNDIHELPEMDKKADLYRIR